ncbi:protein of unknown function [Virgibacillus subterraneus]|uniref:DUF4247 domain-containing protein n=1 Tax=Virgibacillus subterraneus TaxID=621109 RepID=A0A1H9DBM2_9BACI|nr:MULTISPECIES: DUF4247 domain-containing protein [Virgibacillus]SEQ10717.1 protein of unknown function [Virgibacillus subterraneus]
MKKWLIFTGLILIMLIMTSCAQLGPFSDRGMQEEVIITKDDVPQEPDKESIVNELNSNKDNEIDDLIEANFPLMDVISNESNKAEIYATNQFDLTELSSVLTSAKKPKNESEVKDNQQILIYDDSFVTLKESEDDKDVLLLEVASDEFVRQNYSPSFLSTFFAMSLLNNTFGSNNWGCRSGNCYGGYTGKGYYPNGTPNRGGSIFRGGGPGSGK